MTGLSLLLFFSRTRKRTPKGGRTSGMWDSRNWRVKSATASNPRSRLPNSTPVLPLRSLDLPRLDPISARLTIKLPPIAPLARKVL
jgi:hypothetical protein